MKRIATLGVLALLLVGAGVLVYLRAIGDPPTPKVELATPENTHGHRPVSVHNAQVGVNKIPAPDDGPLTDNGPASDGRG